MAKPKIFSTRVLLICAAIGVATGIAAAFWTIPHAATGSGPLIVIYGLVLGFHVLPGVIAQQVLRLPFVALITHLFSTLVSVGFALPFARGYIAAAIVFGGVQEAVSALTRYRQWQPWRFLLAAAITGVLLVVPLWFAFGAGELELWGQVLFVASFVLGPVLWTIVGLGIGTALRKAGVVRGLEGAASVEAD